MASSGTEEEGDRKLLVAIYHPLAPHAERLHDAIEAAGYKAHILPPHVNGLRPWLDICFNLLLINPFLDWQEPFEFVRLRSEEHTSELQSLMRSSYAVFCLKKKTKISRHETKHMSGCQS